MTSIQALIDNELSIKEQRIRSGKYSPSLLGGCYRRQYYNRIDEPKSEDIDNRSLRVFACGDLFHDFVQKLLVKNNPEVKTEVMCEDDDFKGFADIVNGDEVADIKSMHSFGFHYLKDQTVDYIRKEKANNFLQCALYCKLLGKKLIRIVWVSKDDLCIQEALDEYFPYWAGLLDEEITKLQWYWKEKTLPPPEPRLYGVDKKTKKPRECSFCSWKTTCEKTNAKS